MKAWNSNWFLVHGMGFDEMAEHITGVYAIYFDDHLIYIGESQDVRGRLCGKHHTFRPLPGGEYFETVYGVTHHFCAKVRPTGVDKVYRCNLERNLIWRLRPPLNREVAPKLPPWLKGYTI